MTKTLIAVALVLTALAGCASRSQPVARAGQPATATQQTVSLKAGFTPDPYTLVVTAGGNFAASARSAGCTGYIADTPDLILNYTAGPLSDVLYVYVFARSDTTLVIRTPTGAWRCNDDDDLYDDTDDPWVTFLDPRSGAYSIWVGTYAKGEFPAATLYISEIDSSY